MSIIWSELALSKIKELKKTILLKKILLNFVIDNYSWWDKAYRWSLITVASLAPVMGFINTIVENSNGVGILNIIIGCFVAGMIKFKEYVRFGELRDTSKAQTVKYSQLYERIVRESIKSDIKKQPEDEFIYWINREFSLIEIDDPDLSYGDKKKFIDLCILKNIPYDADLDALDILIKEDGVKDGGVLDDKPVKIIIDKSTEVTYNKHPIDASTLDKDASTLDKDASTLDKDASTLDKDASNNKSPNPPNPPSLNVPDFKRERVVSDKRNLIKYKNTIKKVDSKAEIKWAMDRLHDLDELDG
jgi:hypothetical protein